MSETEEGKERDRHPGVVAQTMKELLPEGMEEAKIVLDSIISSAAFRAPEMQGITWNELGDWLKRYVGEPPFAEDWKIHVIACFSTLDEQYVRDNWGVK